MDKINLTELGTKYTVLNRQTNETSQIRVIDYADLKSVIGEFVGQDYKHLGKHIEVILRGFHGFIHSPYEVTWYAATRDKFELSEAIVQADAENNKVVIVEILPDSTEELDTGFKR
jgi:hypothetical protein